MMKNFISRDLQLNKYRKQNFDVAPPMTMIS